MQANPVKIIDTILYNGEPILELRLKLLYDLVDEFVIVEARTTHSGVRKDELYIDKHAARLLEFDAKLTRVIIESFPEPTELWISKQAERPYIATSGFDHWYRENYQRDAAAEHMISKYANERYIVIVCDADEIPKPSVVQALRGMYADLDPPVALSMQMFYYNFAWTIAEPWEAAYVVNNMGFTKYPLTEMRSAGNNRKISNSGWHASNFYDTGGLIRKLQSFAHQELNVEQYTNEQHVRRCIRDGIDLFGREIEHWQAHDIQSLPAEVQQFHTDLLFLQEYS
jgi:beta-1,4-mannosyl-glycoprotein beta-1,4-N-acetylglucosaminyltransferase